MSEARAVVRRFVEEVGVSPRRWLTEQRVLASKGLLETTDLPIEEVARLVGFTSATLLRHHFATAVGVAPLVYRRRFACAGEEAG